MVLGSHTHLEFILVECFIFSTQPLLVLCTDCRSYMNSTLVVCVWYTSHTYPSFRCIPCFCWSLCYSSIYIYVLCYLFFFDIRVLNVSLVSSYSSLLDCPRSIYNVQYNWGLCIVHYFPPPSVSLTFMYTWIKWCSKEHCFTVIHLLTYDSFYNLS